MTLVHITYNAKQLQNGKSFFPGDGGECCFCLPVVKVMETNTLPTCQQTISLTCQVVQHVREEFQCAVAVGVNGLNFHGQRISFEANVLQIKKFAYFIWQDTQLIIVEQQFPATRNVPTYSYKQPYR